MRIKQNNSPPGTKRMPDADLERLNEAIRKFVLECIRGKTTVRDLAYKIKCSESLFYQIQRGGGMKMSTLLKILQGLEMSPEDFFSRLKKCLDEIGPKNANS